MAFSPNFLSQRDPKWRGETLGFDTSLTLGSDGCALTCLAMLVNGYGFDETPSTLNAKLKALGPGNGFLGGLIVWGGLSRLFPKITFQRIVICRDQPAPLQAIDQTLDAGQPLIVEIDSSPAAGLQNHWVVLYARQSGDYLMLDPYPYPPDNRAITLGERYAKGRSPADYITAVVWYQAIGLGPGPSPATGLTVRIPDSVTAGLRVRAAPTTASATLTVEPAGSLLKCLEPESVARPKIGVYDQWLRVSTTGGVEGYVAAWYVEAVEQAPAPVPAPSPQPAPAPEPAPPPVTPPEPSPTVEPLIASVLLSVGTSGLRVRSQPSLAGGYVGVVKAGRQVTVLDPPEEARPKIGKSGQWVFVRTADGKEGYVQAQYLTLGDAVEAGQPSTPPPEPPPQPVPVSPPQPAPVPPAEPAAAAEVGPLIGSVRLSVGTSGLRVRTQPSLAGGYVTIIKAGRQMTLLDPPAEARAKVGRAGQWLYIRTTDGREGYVQAQYVTLDDAAAEAAAAAAPLTVTVAGLVGSGGLRLRAEPSTSAATLKIIAAGTPLTVLESAAAAEAKVGVYGQWLKVREPQGTEGYVAAWYVQR